MSLGMDTSNVAEQKRFTRRVGREEPGGAPELPLGNMTQEEWDEWSSLPTSTDWMDNVGVQELPASCKGLDKNIDIGEKCSVLYDAVGQMVGEVYDVLHDQNMWISYVE